MEYWNWLIKTNSKRKEWEPFPYLVSEDGKLTNGKPVIYNGIPWNKLEKQKVGVKFTMSEVNYNNETIR